MRVQSFLETLFLNTDLFFNSFQEEESQRSEDVNTCLSNGNLFSLFACSQTFRFTKIFNRGQNAGGSVQETSSTQHCPKMLSCPFSGLQRTDNFCNQLHWSLPYTTSFFKKFIIILVYNSCLKCMKYSRMDSRTDIFLRVAFHCCVFNFVFNFKTQQWKAALSRIPGCTGWMTPLTCLGQAMPLYRHDAKSDKQLKWFFLHLVSPKQISTFIIILFHGNTA